MAAIAPTILLVGSGDGSTYTAVWTPVTESDTCVAVSYPEYTVKSIQALGTFGSATVALHGSNDAGVTYAALHTAGTTAIGMTTAGINVVLENTQLVKPVMTGGSGQSLSIAMMFHKPTPMRT